MNGKTFRQTLIGSLREIVFGLEDSLVSTLGTITGVAAGLQNTYVVILAGLVLIAVEATSMAAGSYLSSKSAARADQELAKEQGVGVLSGTTPLRAAAVMFVFYLGGGFVPLLPYFFLPVHVAVWPSVILTAGVLFGVGAWSAAFTKGKAWRGGVEMVVVSLGAAGLGFVIGRLAHTAFGVDVTSL